ncbi:sensor histidine kinase [Marinicellulosiphila megalodicopiae]|uniref:sensor histidine kinase n=1 Tax=Marinicellulosiphila megalodicopiae TaxID=2724896 RepID=UPI003BAE1C36
MTSGTKNSWVEFDTEFVITKILSKDNRLRSCGYHFGDELPQLVIDFIKNKLSFFGYQFEGLDIELIRPQPSQLGFSVCVSESFSFIENKLESISKINDTLMACHSRKELFKQSVSVCLNDLDVDRAGFFTFDHANGNMHGTWGTDEQGQLYEDFDLVKPLQGQDWLLDMLENHETIRIRKNVELETSGRIGSNGWHISIIVWTNDGAYGWLSCDNMLLHRPLYVMQKELMRIFSKTLTQWFSVIENNEKLQNISSELRKVLDEKSSHLQKNIFELSKMHKQVHSFERINMLSKFTSGLAHEINNPNSFVMANISYLLKQETLIQSIDEKSVDESFKKSLLILKDDWADILNDSQEGLKRIKNIITALEPINYCISEEYCDIYIISVLNIISEKYKDLLVINLNIPRDSLFRIKSKKVVIDTVLNNVFKNSFEAYEKDCSSIDDRIVDVNIKDEGGQVMISIRDHASGIKNEDINRIFDPFSTDKNEHKSVGLGLSVAQQLLLSVDGNIYAKICPVGIEIIIELPNKSE